MIRTVPWLGDCCFNRHINFRRASRLTSLFNYSSARSGNSAELVEVGVDHVLTYDSYVIPLSLFSENKLIKEGITS